MDCVLLFRLISVFAYSIENSYNELIREQLCNNNHYNNNDDNIINNKIKIRNNINIYINNNNNNSNSKKIFCELVLTTDVWTYHIYFAISDSLLFPRPPFWKKNCAIPSIFFNEFSTLLN